MVLVFLNTHLGDLLDKSDEALMDFAEKAQNDLMRGRFFHAMSAIRQQRSEFESLFRLTLSKGFDRFEAAPQVPEKPLPEALELTLVATEDMEEAVATENLISRAKSAYYPQLYVIAQRLAVLNQGRRLEEADIPAGPSHLVGTFRLALKPLSLDIKVKIVFYALFDKFVMRQLADMYEEFNSNLKNAGILPNLKPLVVRSKDTPSADHKTANTGVAPRQETSTPAPGAPPSPPTPQAAKGEGLVQAPISLGEELFSTILTLLARRRGGHSPEPMGGVMGGTASRGQPAEGYPGSAARPGPEKIAIRQQLIAVIDGLRPTSVSQPGSVLSDLDQFPNVAVDPGFVEKIRAAVHQEQERIFSQVGREQMPGIDADTIDLIGMLFEYMLNDPLLPNLAKALLSHLHTPYLKLALINRDFLVDSEHPARLLLDQLVEAGGQWVFENDPKRGIFPHMQTVVNRVLKEFQDNVALFAELLDYFVATMEEYRRKSEAVEQRARESIQGREKLRVAKQRASNEMKARASHAFLPNMVQQFLLQTWSDRLVLILLRHPDGESSEEWSRALQVADDLIWLFEPKGTAAELEDLVRVCGLVRDEMQVGLEALGGYHEPHVEKLCALLREPMALLEYATDLGNQRKTLPPAAAKPPVNGDGARSSPPGAKEFPPAPSALGIPPPLPTEPPREERIGLPGDLPARLQKLEFGTWIEFQEPGGAAPRRLKLSWSSPLTGTCMFVDRSGLQAEVRPMAELSRMLALGQAKMIPQPRHPFVERTLSAIRRVLEGSP